MYIGIGFGIEVQEKMYYLFGSKDRLSFQNIYF